ncbi:hypothetical protein [Microbacterium sp. AG157]|uniref:hypothetical protein n=1 Tax=Microbacterium sp. AG157 TaxID=2183993 RepID=UPI0011C04DDC|nr:hypothetical protein [Microbacterium sp. AG157]
MGLSFGILAVSVAVAGAVMFIAMPRIGTPGPMTLFLRFAAVAGVTAAGSSAMYFIYGAGGGILPLVLGDVAMVLAPALLIVALSALEGRRARNTSIAILALALALAVALVTATVPLPGSLAAKAVAVAVTCGACGWVASHSRVEPFGPLRVIALTSGVFAVYSLFRAIVGLVVGWDSVLYRVAFSFAPATILGALAVLAIGAAVVRVRFGPRVTVDVAERAAGSVVVVGDWDLASTAYGPDRVRGLVADLRAAARDLDPAAVDVPRGTETLVPDAVSVLSDRLRRDYGWEPEQTILLVDGATTSAIRTRPRVRVEKKRGSARS